MPYLDKAKAKEAHLRWRRSNRDKLAKWGLAWREKNPEKARAIQLRAAAKRKPAARLRMATKYAENPELFRERSRLAYRADKQAAADRNKRWRAENPEAVKAIKLNRRVRLLAAGQPSHGKISAADIAAIVKRQKGRCASCGEKAPLEMDHMMPLALGGSGDKTNFQGLCRPCNLSKHARHPIDFNRSRGLLL